jgi:ferric-dicitrate binding protein FerR (iron transport regulator)
LKYPGQFIGGSRSVELIGEAFFDVFHDKEVPFHVYTRNLDIKVLGTTFNVLANENEKTEEIVLQTGKVDVMDKSGKQLAVLLPDNQLIFSIEKLTVTKKTVEASQYTSWKEGKLVFKNENMQQVVNRLSRWYNVDVVMNDSVLDKYTYHATFIDESLDEVLKLISITTPISFTAEKRTSDTNGTYIRRKVILRENKSKTNQFR